jgi:hypothetical protein
MQEHEERNPEINKPGVLLAVEDDIGDRRIMELIYSSPRHSARFRCHQP